jgi:mono/diheme cytochrome c family protein
MKFKDVILAGGILGTLAACTENPNQTKLQYFPDMADSPAFKTQGNYIDPPEGSIARTAILYPDTPEEAEKVLQNPFRGQPNEDKHIANGEHLFNTFCAVCHGMGGKGDGTISDKFPRPPDLMLDMYKKRQDGFFFYRITFGSALMPSYGHAIAPNERWQIVSYLRTLQNAPAPEPAPATPAAPAVPTEPVAPAAEPAKTDGAKKP